MVFTCLIKAPEGLPFTEEFTCDPGGLFVVVEVKTETVTNTRI